jgi:hypothetical protein
MYFIHKYEVSLQYGGPEEGGWYYEVGTPIKEWHTPGFTEEETAFAVCRAYNISERERAKAEEDYGYSSVLAYRSQHYAYDVDESPTATPYPEVRPHYE